MDKLYKLYYTIFIERSDPRVETWFYVNSPMMLFGTIVGYLLMIKVILPTYMKHRAPYKLKHVIRWYNILMIIANFLVFRGIYTSGWTTKLTFGCELPDYSNDPEAVRLLSYMWWTIMVKLVEMLETMFYVLRKRDRQASLLHIYHHIVTLIIIWAGTKYVGGGMTSFTPMINNAMHVIMYSYYLAALEGSPKTRAFLNRYKKWLTVMQMTNSEIPLSTLVFLGFSGTSTSHHIIQLAAMFIHGVQIYMPWCPAPIGMAYVFFPNVLIVFLLFLRFYRENYEKNIDNNGLNGAMKTKLQIKRS